MFKLLLQDFTFLEKYGESCHKCFRGKKPSNFLIFLKPIYKSK